MARDSGNTVNDCEIMIAIYNPNRDGLKTYGGGYNIEALDNGYRSLQVLKSRYGESDIEDHVMMYGEIGVFKELPKPDEIYDYNKYRDPLMWLKEIESDELYMPDDDSNFKYTL